MDEPGKTFTGFEFSTQTFHVTASQLKIIRTWRRSQPDSAGKPELSVFIDGRGVGNRHAVCVIGTTEQAEQFDLTIRADNDAKGQWAIVKERSLFSDRGHNDNNPERRIRNHIYQTLDKMPPTAALFVTYANNEIGTKDGWTLECQVPHAVFEQLCTDVAAGRTVEVEIGIDWVAGLVRDSLYWTTWGMFRLSATEPPEPLHGYVSLIRFEPPARTRAATPQRVSEKLAEACEAWTKPFAEPSENNGENWKRRSASLLAELAISITKLCDREGESIQRFRGMMGEAEEFIQRLDEALHQKNGPYADEQYAVWQHRHLGDLLLKTKPSQRENFADLTELGRLVSEYLYNPHLQHPYLDWLILDAMTSGKIVAALEPWLREKHGMAYDLFEGVRWKMAIWKFVVWPLTFVVGWSLPAVVSYLTMARSVNAAFAVGAIWYGVNILLLVRWLWHRIALLLTGQRTPSQRMLNVVEQAEQAYAFLAGPVMHIEATRSAFERAAAKGVVWDQRVFYILDRIAHRKPEIWENQLRRSGATVSKFELSW